MVVMKIFEVYITRDNRGNVDLEFVEESVREDRPR